VNDITFDEVISAYYDCRRNKRNTKQQLHFEFHLENNLWNLYEELKNETFTPSIHLFFVITKPKPREVWAAEFGERQGWGAPAGARDVQKSLRNL
jgi:hypothetical protein